MKPAYTYLLLILSIFSYKAKSQFTGSHTIRYTDSIVNFYGSAINFKQVAIPLYDDSTAIAVVNGQADYIKTHAIYYTYDPHSLMHGTNTISTNFSDFSIDRVHVVGQYNSPSSIPNPQGDSLIVEIMWAQGSNIGNYFQGIWYPPNGGNPDTCFTSTPEIKIDHLTQKWRLKNSNYTRTAIALDSSHITKPNDTFTSYTIPVHNLVRNYWNKMTRVAISIRFKSAYRTNISTGDTIYNDSIPDDAKIPSFAVAKYIESPGGILPHGIRYFQDPLGRNGTGDMDNKTLYGLNNNFRDYSMQSKVTSAYRISLTVSKGLNQDEHQKKSILKTYPNPSNGLTTFEITDGGKYTITIMNPTGQLVYEEKLITNSNATFRRDLSHLTKGFYLVRIDGEHISESLKLLLN